ncbi:hypothetical protein HBI49_185690 [Parastagonospora nodorum]|nr:hypothetical protein HBI49_185690 [Parastagonospora nodorum]
MPIHSDICEELELERAIVRTANTIQKAYFAFREPLFEKSIVKVEERDHELVLHQGNTETGKRKGSFADLPSHIIEKKGIAEAILCFLVGREPLAYLLDLIQYLTDGKMPAVEVQVRLKNIPRNTTVIYANGVQQSVYPDNPHFVLRLTSMESKKTWAIDITGAQFGFTQNLWLWEEYSNKHLETVEEINELNTSWVLLKTLSSVQGAPSVDFGIPFAAMGHVNLALKSWEETELDKRIFVLLHDKNFAVAQVSLIQTIKKAMCKFVDESDYSKEVQEAVEYEQRGLNAGKENLVQLHSTLSRSMHSEPRNKNCSSCGEPAIMRCGQCRLHVYCNDRCQKAHWIEHRKMCKITNLDKIMHRAGALLQRLYLIFCRTTFRNQFTKIEDSGRHLTIHMKTSTTKDSMFVPFPDLLIPSENDSKMILCASRCCNFVGYFKTIIEMVLEDSDVIVDEVCIQMKPPERSAILEVEGHGSSKEGHNSHYLFQVTKQLPFKQWILDITGPQLNVFDPCLELPKYTAKYVDRFRLTAPLGTASILFENLADLKGLAGLEARIDRDAVRALVMGICEWQTRASSNLPELLRRPESIFKKQQQELSNIVQESLNQYVLSVDYTSELSSVKHHTIVDLLSTYKTVFSKHEGYLRQFAD